MPKNITILRRQPVVNSHNLPADLHPVLARIYIARNLTSGNELDHSLDGLLQPEQMKGIGDAVRLLAVAIQQQQRILIVADFDADGASSCALVIRALRLMGARDVRYLAPNRFEYGYGLTPEIVEVAATEAPDLIVTVDNGISSLDGVQAAKERGMAVLITDHHLTGESLPAADAIVNPNQPGDEFASKHLAGVGVIFYVMLALRTHLRDTGWFAQAGIEVPNLAQLLDLVALGTVADLVPLDRNNRILVAQGLARINAGRCCAGIQALLEISGRRLGRLTTTDLGYYAAPRLNAAGRLQDMSLSIECLLTDSHQQAREMATQLDKLNRERRTIQAEMQQQALAAVKALHLELGLPSIGVCLYDENWHQGVIGLVAAKVKERLHRPVIAFAPAGDSELKGSARSISGLHIRDALDAVAAHHPELLKKFGGHAMAAGLTIMRGHLDAFSRAFDEEVSRQLGEDDLQEKLLTDGELVAEEIEMELAESLRAAGPWGQGFPEPLFDGLFEVVDRRVVGARHLKMVLRHSGTRDVDAIAFNQAPNGKAPDWPRILAAYRLDVNEFRGNRSLQLVVEFMRPQDAQEVTVG